MNTEQICYIFDVDFEKLSDTEANFTLKVESLAEFQYEKFIKSKLIAIRAEKRYVALAKVDGISLKENEPGWSCEFSINSFCTIPPETIKLAVLRCTSSLLGLNHMAEHLKSATFSSIRPKEIPLRLNLADAVSAVACKYGVDCRQVSITISSKPN